MLGGCGSDRGGALLPVCFSFTVLCPRQGGEHTVATTLQCSYKEAWERPEVDPSPLQTPFVSTRPKRMCGVPNDRGLRNRLAAFLTRKARTNHPPTAGGGARGVRHLPENPTLHCAQEPWTGKVKVPSHDVGMVQVTPVTVCPASPPSPSPCVSAAENAHISDSHVLVGGPMFFCSKRFPSCCTYPEDYLLSSAICARPF